MQKTVELVSNQLICGKREVIEDYAIQQKYAQKGGKCCLFSDDFITTESEVLYI